MSLTLVCLYIIIGLCFLLFINYKFLKIFITPNRKYSATAAAAAVAADANSNTSSVTNKNTVNNNLNQSNNHHHQHHNHNNNNVPAQPQPPPLNHHLHHTQHMSHHHTLAAVAAAATSVTTNSSRNDLWSIPGPLSIPFFGTKWIYLWKYKLSKIHEVYRGKCSLFGGSGSLLSFRLLLYFFCMHLNAHANGFLFFVIFGSSIIYLLLTQFFPGSALFSFVHKHADFKRDYGPIVLEVTPNGIPVVNLYNRQDIERVLRFPSKYPFRPPTEIVAFYRKMRPDRYASTGITNE